MCLQLCNAEVSVAFATSLLALRWSLIISGSFAASELQLMCNAEVSVAFALLFWLFAGACIGSVCGG